MTVLGPKSMGEISPKHEGNVGSHGLYYSNIEEMRNKFLIERIHSLAFRHQVRTIGELGELNSISSNKMVRVLGCPGQEVRING